MAAILNFGSGTMSANVRGDISRSGMVDNVGVAVGIWSQAHSIQLLFPFPVSVAAILIFGNQPTSGNVGPCRTMWKVCESVTLKSGKAEKRGVAVGIAAPTLAVQKLFPLPV